MTFQTDLQMHWTAAGDYRLLTDLVYVGRHDLIVIPAGFRTDLATVPRAIRWLLPSDGAWSRAAILHDYCLQHPKRFTGRDTDGLFRRVCREEGVPVLARRLLWTGVRYGALARDRHSRVDWWRDAAAVAVMTVIGAVLVVPTSVAVMVALVLYVLAETVATTAVNLIRKDRP